MTGSCSSLPDTPRARTLADHAHLGLDRTATPLELDEIFSSINDLDKALGPDGANKADAGGVGPLTRLLDSTARNFGGQGVEFNKTLKNFGAFTKTLADNKDALFSTLGKVEDFTGTLKKNDTTVRRFNDSLAQGANLLAGERQDLAAVLHDLSIALVQVRSFVKENRASLTSNIAGLNQISKILVKRRDALDEILRVAPAALNNLFLAGNVKDGHPGHPRQPRRAGLQADRQPGPDPVQLRGPGRPDRRGVQVHHRRAEHAPRCRGRGPSPSDTSTTPRVRRAHRPVHGRTDRGYAMKPLDAPALPGLRVSCWALLACALVLSGCSIYDAPLPGGPNTGKNPIKVTVMFRDVLDLVPQSTVKVNDVSVGKVSKVTLKGYVAKVTIELPHNVDLPDNATALIRQTSLLGEKFVDLEQPRNPSSNKLSNGDVIGLDRTGRNPEVEEVLGALALLLNGGGVGQLKTIAAELNNAFGGRESEVRSVLDQIRIFTGTLDDNKASIVAALENTNRLAGRAAQADRHHQGDAGRRPRRPGLDQPPARRPGQAAQGADPAQQRRRQGDPGLQGVDDQQPARPRARPRRVRQGRAELPEVLPGLPDLPLRRRGRRPRPAGGPQPAHG